MAVYNAKKLTITKDGNTYIIDPMQGNEAVYIDLDVKIRPSDWISGTGEYTYVYTNSHLTRNSAVFVNFKNTMADSDLETLTYLKETGKITFSITEMVSDDVDLVVRVVDATTEGVYPIDAEMVETDAVVGETTVQGALEDLDNRISSLDEVTYAHEIVTNDEQSSVGEYLMRTTGGDASLSDGAAKLVSVQGRSYKSGESSVIQMSNPTKFISTGWNLYNHNNGYIKVLKYSDTYGFIIEGTYTTLKYSDSLTGDQETITPDGNGKFTIPGDGYLFVTGGNSINTAIYMTWSDWVDGHDGEWKAYEESVVDFSDVMANYFPYGLFAVGSVYDEVNFSNKQAISRIERIPYSAPAIDEVISSGRPYDTDKVYIYVVRETPIVNAITVSGDHIACDHGYEIIVGGTVAPYVQTLYGQNLVDKLRHDIPEKLDEHDVEIDSLKHRTVNGEEADENGNWQIDEVPYTRQILTDDAQQSTEKFLIRTTAGDASISDGKATAQFIRGNTKHTGIVEESLNLTVNAVPRAVPASITATIDRNTFLEYVTESGTIYLTYTTEWSANPALYGVTVTGTPVNGDSIVIDYVKLEVDETVVMTVNAAERTAPAAITAEINASTFKEYVDDDASIDLTYTNDWSADPALYGITVNGTPQNGDVLHVEYTKEKWSENIDMSVDAAIRMPPEAITAVINESTFKAYVGNTSGTYVMNYSNDAWDIDPALYGVTVSNVPVNGDKITIVYVAYSENISASSTGGNISSIVVNESVFKTYVNDFTGIYIMNYSNGNWNVDPSNYGVSFSGIPENGDTITISYIKTTESISMSVDAVQRIAPAAITAVINESVFKDEVSESATIVLNYTDSWSENPATYGVTVSNNPISGDKITIVYVKTKTSNESLYLTVVAPRSVPDAITAVIDKEAFIEYAETPGTVTLNYSNDWSADPEDYGITVTGVPVSGDQIVVVYTKTTIHEENLNLSVIAPRTAPPPISVVIDRDTFVGHVSISGTTTLSYTNAWSSNPADYGITVSNTPVSGDEIVIVYVKASRGLITMANPRKLMSTGWNLYNHSNGYARVLKYSDTYGFRVAGTYTKLEYSATLTGSKTQITVTNSSFTIPADGYVWVTGGNNTNTAIYMTWSDWTGGYPGSFAAYSETGIDLTSLMTSRFPYGLMAVGVVYDEIDFVMKQAISRIQRIAYSDSEYEAAKASGRAYDADESYIYLEKSSPDVYSISITNTYNAYDHGIEYITNTEIDVLVSVLYGQNLVDKLRNDVAVGPSTATNENFVSFNGTGGKLLKDSGKKASDFATKAEGVTNITRNGTTFTVTRADGTTFTFTQQDNNTTYSQISRGSGAGLAPGLPSGSGTTKYLREDGTWQVPPDNNTTYSQISRGSGAGLAPGLPSGSGTTKYLREDGTWQVPPDTDTNTTYSAASGGGLSLSGTAFSLANSGVTAGSYGPSANATPGYGSTFNVPYLTVDAKGRVTAASTKTVKIPASDNTYPTIRDALTYNESSTCLSSKQGKVLNDNKQDKEWTATNAITNQTYTLPDTVREANVIVSIDTNLGYIYQFHIVDFGTQDRFYFSGFGETASSMGMCQLRVQYKKLTIAAVTFMGVVKTSSALMQVFYR